MKILFVFWLVIEIFTVSSDSTIVKTRTIKFNIQQKVNETDSLTSKNKTYINKLDSIINSRK